tara:strand:+ start:4604 stop:7195 length:2592 start_codon:yes stop_codon:yes gene_type:complete
MLELKKIINELENSRQKIKDQFFLKPDGLRAAVEYTQVIDTTIIKIFSNCVNNEKFGDVVLCAAGGYGRKELAPFSDIDILFFTEKKITNIKINNAIKKILYTLWDCGFKVGYSLRNLNKVIISSEIDLASATNMLDARYLAGNYLIYKKFKKKVSSFFENEKKFIDLKVNEKKLRLSERNNDKYILEPDIKYSRGGLRDINLIFWVMKIKHSMTDPDELLESKLITKYERRRIKSLLIFTFTVRYFLHYLSNRPNDRLTFEYQKRISSAMKYKSRKKTLGVERFMKHFHLNVRSCISLSYIILDASVEKNFFLSRIDQFSFTKDRYISKDNFLHLKDKHKLKQNPKLIMEFFLECQSRQLHPGYSELRIIVNTLNFLNNSCFNTKFIKQSFIFILVNDKDNILIDLLNETGLLSKIVPFFNKIIALSQFDQYHAYSVDQHIMKALRNLKHIDYEKIEINSKYLSKICHSIKNKKILYFSVLLHDIGKGSDHDHTTQGSKYSKSISTFFDLNNKDLNDIAWLVKNHLEFCNTAFKKDIEDPKVINDLCINIGDYQRFLSLFIISVVDLKSVNNSVWNEWKESLLRKLFTKCEDYFIDPKLTHDSKRHLDLKKSLTRKLLVLTNPETLKKLDKIACDEYWLMQDPESLAFQVDRFFSNKAFFNQDNYHLKNDSVFGFFELIIVTKNRSQLFTDIVKSIINSEMKVMDAKIFTFNNNMVVDIFKISPLKNLQNITEADLSKFKKKLKNNLKIFFKNDTQTTCVRKEDKKFLRESIDIRFDNQNHSYTILEIRTNDRDLLLLDILESINYFEADVLSAKISTLGDMVEDIFHLKKNDSGIRSQIDLNKLKKIIEENIVKSRDRIVN